VQIVRLTIVTVICLGLAFVLFASLVGGLRTGKMPHTDSTSICRRSENPVGFWALATLFAAFALAAVGAWLRVVAEFIHV
jgi:hypothetical protein